MRRPFLFALELIIVSALILVTRCANYRDVFANGQIYFVDADCYARMTRARICFEHPGTIVRHHDFENYPMRTSPHTTAPFDYLIVGLAKVLGPFTHYKFNLTGVLVSPLLAVGTGIFLCWWTRRMQVRFRFAVLTLFAVSPILAHGTALGRPDHQSLLIALIAVALCTEWTLWRAADNSASSWSIVCGICWALACWVSVYEPLVLFALTFLISLVTKRKTFSRAGWIAFAALMGIAFVIERRLPAWPGLEFARALQNWSGGIGELSRIPIYSRVWFEWCGWLILFAPVLFWRRERRAPLFLVVLLIVTFALTMVQARWGYFFALTFALLAPGVLSVVRKPLIATAVFVIALFPIAKAWEVNLSDRASAIRAENQIEQMELRAIASEIDGPLLAPWWFSPALGYWSRQPAVAGSSHESISGIVDCASFYAAIEPERAAEICRRRQVKWVVSYDSDRVAENSARILDHSISDSALCYVLDRHPSAAPPFLKLVRQTARFKLYRVEGP